MDGSCNVFLGHIFSIIKKKKFDLSHISFLQTIITAGLIFLLPAYLIEIALGYRLNIHIPFILTLSYVVLFPGLASFFFWIKGISIVGSNRSGIFLHMMPIFSTLMAILIFKEKFVTYHFIGAMLIIAGIVLSSKGRHVWYKHQHKLQFTSWKKFRNKRDEINS